MLTPQEKQWIEDEINEWTDGGKMFTALEITVAVQNKYKADVSHKEVKAYLHSLFKQGFFHASYNRSLVKLDPKVPKAWMYYPNWELPDNYHSTLSVRVKTGNIVPPTHMIGYTSGPTAAYITQKDGRLNIGSKFMDMLDVSDGNIVAVKCDNVKKEIVISNNILPGLKKYTVSGKRIRLSPRVLVKAGLSPRDKFKIEYSNNIGIIVTKG